LTFSSAYLGKQRLANLVTGPDGEKEALTVSPLGGVPVHTYYKGFGVIGGYF
jgi:hypothetical protein